MNYKTPLSELCIKPPSNMAGSNALTLRSTIAAEQQAYWAGANTIVGGIGLIALAGALFTSVRSAKAARTSADAAVAALERTTGFSQSELRPYVVLNPTFAIAFDSAKPPGFRFTLANIGKTPALQVRHRVAIGTLENPVVGANLIPALTECWSADFSLMSNQVFEVEYHSDGTLSEAEIKALRDGSRSLCVRAECSYNDIFGHCHTTQVCSIVTGEADQIQKLTERYEPSDLKLRFILAPSGNVLT